MKTTKVMELWFKAEGFKRAVTVIDDFDISDLKNLIFYYHSDIFPKPTKFADWHLYKSDQSHEPEDLRASISVLGSSGTADGPEIVLKRVSWLEQLTLRVSIADCYKRH
jgi:hypothetical protein